MFYMILRKKRDYFPNSFNELLLTTGILRWDPNSKYYVDEFHNSVRC